MYFRGEIFMKKYNVFELWVVKEEDCYFICEKSSNENIYIEIFTEEKFKVLDKENVESLKNYYSLPSIINYSAGENLMLTKKSLLLKYAEINSSNIEKRKQHNNNCETIIKEQEEYIKALKKSVEKNPEKAKQETVENLRRTGILDENCELSASYNMTSIGEEEICVPIEHSKTLIRKKNKN